MSRKDIAVIVALMSLLVLAFLLSMYIGHAAISFNEVFRILLGADAGVDTWSYIVEARFNRSLVAIFGGGGLAVAGLILQVFFRNPLAGPGVLGITSGASLGVALVVLGGFTLQTVIGGTGVIVFGAIGAFSVLLLLIFVSRFIKNEVTLLVIGLMIGYFTAAFVNMLFLWADQNETREFVIWGLGSFAQVDTHQLWIFVLLIAVASLCTIFMIKGMNAMTLGADYARSLGINMRKNRYLMIIITSVLAAVVTAYCGPISFIGIAVPQLIRVVTKTRNYSWMLPLTFVAGALLGIVSDIIVRLSDSSLPLNTVTALIGAPIIIWTIIKMNRRFASL